MKPLNYLYSTLLFFLLVTIGACSNDDNQVQDKEVPLPIKNDFLGKYPVAQIKSFHSYSNGIQQIDFIDHVPLGHILISRKHEPNLKLDLVDLCR